MKVGDKVRCIGTRTSSDYVGIEGIIDIVVTTTSPKTIHVGINVTNRTLRYTGIHTFIYCSDLIIIPKELNTNTRLI